jgi:hypothetical protein
VRREGAAGLRVGHAPCRLGRRRQNELNTSEMRHEWGAEIQPLLLHSIVGGVLTRPARFAALVTTVDRFDLSRRNEGQS